MFNINSLTSVFPLLTTSTLLSDRVLGRRCRLITMTSHKILLYDLPPSDLVQCQSTAFILLSLKKCETNSIEKVVPWAIVCLNIWPWFIKVGWEGGGGGDFLLE